MQTEIVQPQFVLSVRQPWAWLIMNGGKDIENRTWRTDIRGRVFIHASKGVTKEEWQDAWDWVRMTFPEVWEKGRQEIKPGSIERGGIVGSVELVDCVTSSSSEWFAGRYGFVLRDPQKTPFFPCKGRLGFFKAEDIKGFL